MVDPGAMLAGRYRLTARLGRGGMGEVWSAVDQDLGRRVAIKIVLVELDTDPGLTARLRREAQVAAGLRHPGITVVHDIGEHQGHPFFVMELLEGTDLKALLTGHPSGLPVERAAGFMVQVADALEYAHRKGVVHRDIKPANIMELSEGGLKICDFGISRYAGATADLTAPGGLLGTPAYMAPEQYKGLPADARTDLYSLGCTLYALLTGRPPFPGPSAAAMMNQHLTSPAPRLTALRPAVPADLDQLAGRLLAKDPAHRPATAAEVRDVLRVIVFRPQPGPGPGAGAAPARQARPALPGTEPRPREPAVHPTLPPSSVIGRRRLLLAAVAIGGAGAVAVPAVILYDKDRPDGSGSPGGRVPPTSTTPSPVQVAPVMERSLSGHTDTITAMDYSPNGRLLASGGKDETVRLWDVATGANTATLTGHKSWVRAVDFSARGGLLASGGDDKTVRLWNPATHQAEAVLTGHGQGVFAVAFSPDGRLLASGSEDDTARLWDVATHSTIATLRGHTSWVNDLVFSPDGSLLATCADDRTVRLWTTATGRIAATFDGAPTWVHAMAFSPDGRLLATCGNDDVVRLWEVATHRLVLGLAGHTDSVNDLAFSPDGRLLATCGNDDVVRLWEVATGRAAAILTGHTSDVEAVAINPDGKSLAAADSKEIRLWQLVESS